MRIVGIIQWCIMLQVGMQKRYSNHKMDVHQMEILQKMIMMRVELKQIHITKIIGFLNLFHQVRNRCLNRMSLEI